MKKYLFTALLAIAFTFTTSAANISVPESFERIQLNKSELAEIELKDNVIIAAPGEEVDEDCVYIGSEVIITRGGVFIIDYYIC